MLGSGLDDRERAPRTAGSSLDFFWELGLWFAGLPHHEATLVVNTPTVHVLPGVLCGGFVDRALKAATEQLPATGEIVWLPVGKQAWQTAQVESDIIVSGQPVLVARILGSPVTRRKVRSWLPARGVTGPAKRRVRTESIQSTVFGEDRGGAMGILPHPRCVLVGCKEDLLTHLSAELTFVPGKGNAVTGSLGHLLALETPRLMGHAHTCVIADGADTLAMTPDWSRPDLLVLAGARASLRWSSRRLGPRTILVLERSARAFDEAIRHIAGLHGFAHEIAMPETLVNRIPGGVEVYTWGAR